MYTPLNPTLPYIKYFSRGVHNMDMLKGYASLSLIGCIDLKEWTGCLHLKSLASSPIICLESRGCYAIFLGIVSHDLLLLIVSLPDNLKW